MPVGAVIDSVQIKLWCDKNSSIVDLGLHRADQLWGEGSSAASTQHGKGTAATSGDATWTDAIFGATVLLLEHPWGRFLHFRFCHILGRREQRLLHLVFSTIVKTWSIPIPTLDGCSKQMMNPSLERQKIQHQENNNNGAAHAPLLIVYSSLFFGNGRSLWFELYPNPERI